MHPFMWNSKRLALIALLLSTGVSPVAHAGPENMGGLGTAIIIIGLEYASTAIAIPNTIKAVKHKGNVALGITGIIAGTITASTGAGLLSTSNKSGGLNTLAATLLLSGAINIGAGIAACVRHKEYPPVSLAPVVTTEHGIAPGLTVSARFK